MDWRRGLIFLATLSSVTLLASVFVWNVRNGYKDTTSARRWVYLSLAVLAITGFLACIGVGAP